MKCVNKSNLNNSKYLLINNLYSYTVMALTKTILTDGSCIALTDTGVFIHFFILLLSENIALQ